MNTNITSKINRVKMSLTLLNRKVLFLIILNFQVVSIMGWVSSKYLGSHQTWGQILLYFDKFECICIFKFEIKSICNTFEYLIFMVIDYGCNPVTTCYIHTLPQPPITIYTLAWLYVYTL